MTEFFDLIHYNFEFSILFDADDISLPSGKITFNWSSPQTWIAFIITSW